MSASPLFPKIPSSFEVTTARIMNDKIAVKMWQRRGPAGRAMFIVHGLGEQSDRYEHFPFYLQDQFSCFVLLDLPGHGLSKGRRAYIQSFDQFSQAVLAAFDWGHKQNPTAQWHWFGHSMGGLITLRTLLKKHNLPLASVIASSPALGVAAKVPFYKIAFARIVESFCGWLPIATGVPSTVLSHDASVQQEFNANKANLSIVTPRLFLQMGKEMELLKAPSEAFSYSLLMVVSLDDGLASWKSSLRFFDRLKLSPGKKKELQMFPNFRHEAFNEVEKGRAFNALQSWIERIGEKK